MISAAPPLSPPALGYQPLLDGIRGVAVAVVVAFNLKWKWLPGGFIGVDIFFALSGFLITTLLAEEWLARGRISVSGFLARRALRLYPALAVLAVCILLFSFLLQDHDKAVSNARLAVAALAWGANWLCVSDTYYSYLVLGHTWSLGVEAQFYLLWAVILPVVLGTTGGKLRIVGWVAGGTVTAVLVWRAWLFNRGHDWVDLYLRTDTRLDGVFVGTLAAVVRMNCFDQSGRHSVRGWASFFSGLGALFAIVILGGALLTWREDSPIPYLGGFTLVATSTTVLILHGLAMPDSLVSRCLCAPLLVWLGKISYSLYLWHVPVASLLRSRRLQDLGLGSVSAEIVRLAISIILATGSYYLVERKLRSYLWRRAA